MADGQFANRVVHFLWRVNLVNSEVGMRVSAEREKVRFASGGTECAAWHYPGTSGACVSGGQPRQVVRIREQLADWQAAIRFAAGLPGVDPARLEIWDFSLAGGHVFRVAARDAELAAAIAQTPNADGQAAARNAARHQKPLALLRLTGRGVLDALGGVAGRQPRLVPLAGEPGTVAVLTTQSALAGPAASAANRAPKGELVRMPGGHYEPFLGGHEQAVEAELSFLRRHLLDPSPEDRNGPAPADSALHRGGRA
jgi:uncharacterized protein